MSAFALRKQMLEKKEAAARAAAEEAVAAISVEHVGVTEASSIQQTAAEAKALPQSQTGKEAELTEILTSLAPIAAPKQGSLMPSSEQAKR